MSRLRTNHRRALTLGALWAVASGAVFALPSCYGRACDFSVYNYGAEPGQGRMIDENTWESTSFNSKWIFFPGNRTVFFDVPQLGRRVPFDVRPFVSGAEEPATTNFTAGSGNLAVISGIGENRVAVNNSSCSDYYLRVVIEVPPFPPMADAGVPDVIDGDAGDAGDGGS